MRGAGRGRVRHQFSRRVAFRPQVHAADRRQFRSGVPPGSRICVAAVRQLERSCRTVLDHQSAQRQPRLDRSGVVEVQSPAELVVRGGEHLHVVRSGRGGLGVSILPRMALPLPDNPTLAAVPVRNPVVHRTVGIVEDAPGSSHAPRWTFAACWSMRRSCSTTGRRPLRSRPWRPGQGGQTHRDLTAAFFLTSRPIATSRLSIPQVCPRAWPQTLPPGLA